MRRLAVVARNRDDGDVDQTRPRPRHEVGESGLLYPFPRRDRDRVVLARVGMAADLQPRLLSLVPAQQDALRGGMDDQSRTRDVHGLVASPRVT